MGFFIDNFLWQDGYLQEPNKAMCYPSPSEITQLLPQRIGVLTSQGNTNIPAESQFEDVCCILFIMFTATSNMSYNSKSYGRQRASASSFIFNFHICFIIVSFLFTTFLLRASLSAYVSRIYRPIFKIQWSAPNSISTSSRDR